MMHLKFPRSRGFLRWDELGCLARALGFHENLFVNNLPEELISGRPGVTVEEFHDMFDLHKYFNAALDRTSNIHTDEWNIHSIKKVVQLLDKHVFTFEDIEGIRLAYEVYESSDTRGMCVDEKLLQRAIKMCGRMISPQKMLQRIKHMAARFEEPDHIQLHEFLDLLLWCQMYEGIVIKAEDLNVRKDERDLFQLEDFEQLLSFYDKRLASDLDEKYKKDELKFVKEKFGSKRLPRDVPPVDQEIRKRQVRYHKCRYKSLHREIGDSLKRVDSSRAGYVRDRPISAPDLTMYQHVDPSVAMSALEVRQTTVMDMFGHLIRPKSVRSAQEQTIERPNIEEYVRPKTPSAVKPKDIVRSNNKMNSLQYEIETMDEKYKVLLEEDLDYLLPGYRERIANRPKTAPEPRPPQPKAEARPTEQTLRRLAYPFKHGLPLPSHAKACDARYRGWHGVKTKPGSHYVLCSTAFDSSPNGTMLAKLQKAADAEIKRNPLIHRYTHQHQVVPPSLRPHTSPALLMKSSKPDRIPTDSHYNVDATDTQILNLEKSPQEPMRTEHSPSPETGNLDISDINKKDLTLEEPRSEPETSNTAITKTQLKETVTSKTDKTKSTECPPKPMRTSGLEDIKELEEEDTVVPRQVDVVCVKRAMGSDKAKANVMLQDEASTSCTDSKVGNSDIVAEHHKREEQLYQEKPDYIHPWFHKNSAVKQYNFVLQIMNTDFNERERSKKEKYNYRRLSRRGQGIISRQLSKKLVKGISA